MLIVLGAMAIVLVVVGAGTLMARLMTDLSEIGDIWHGPERQTERR